MRIAIPFIVLLLCALASSQHDPNLVKHLMNLINTRQQQERQDDQMLEQAHTLFPHLPPEIRHHHHHHHHHHQQVPHFPPIQQHIQQVHFVPVLRSADDNGLDSAETSVENKEMRNSANENTDSNVMMESPFVGSVQNPTFRAAIFMPLRERFQPPPEQMSQIVFINRSPMPSDDGTSGNARSARTRFITQQFITPSTQFVQPTGISVQQVVPSRGISFQGIVPTQTFSNPGFVSTGGFGSSLGQSSKIIVHDKFIEQGQSFSNFRDANEHQTEEQTSENVDQSTSSGQQMVGAPYFIDAPSFSYAREDSPRTSFKFSHEPSSHVHRIFKRSLSTEINNEGAEKSEKETLNTKESSIENFLDSSFDKDASKEVNSRTKRTLTLIRLLTNPRTTVDIPGTIENINSVTTRAVDSPDMPLFHVRNALGSAGKAFVSAIRIPDASQWQNINGQNSFIAEPMVSSINPSQLSDFNQNVESSRSNQFENTNQQTMINSQQPFLRIALPRKNIGIMMPFSNNVESQPLVHVSTSPRKSVSVMTPISTHFLPPTWPGNKIVERAAENSQNTVSDISSTSENMVGSGFTPSLSRASWNMVGSVPNFDSTSENIVGAINPALISSNQPDALDQIHNFAKQAASNAQESFAYLGQALHSARQALQKMRNNHKLFIPVMKIPKVVRVSDDESVGISSPEFQQNEETSSSGVKHEFIVIPANTTFKKLNRRRPKGDKTFVLMPLRLSDVRSMRENTPRRFILQELPIEQWSNGQSHVDKSSRTASDMQTATVEQQSMGSLTEVHQNSDNIMHLTKTPAQTQQNGKDQVLGVVNNVDQRRSHIGLMWEQAPETFPSEPTQFVQRQIQTDDSINSFSSHIPPFQFPENQQSIDSNLRIIPRPVEEDHSQVPSALKLQTISRSANSNFEDLQSAHNQVANSDFSQLNTQSSIHNRNAMFVPDVPPQRQSLENSVRLQNIEFTEDNFENSDNILQDQTSINERNVQENFQDINNEQQYTEGLKNDYQDINLVHFEPEAALKQVLANSQEFGGKQISTDDEQILVDDNQENENREMINSQSYVDFGNNNDQLSENVQYVPVVINEEIPNDEEFNAQNNPELSNILSYQLIKNIQTTDTEEVQDPNDLLAVESNTSGYDDETENASSQANIQNVANFNGICLRSSADYIQFLNGVRQDIRDSLYNLNERSQYPEIRLNPVFYVPSPVEYEQYRSPEHVGTFLTESMQKPFMGLATPQQIDKFLMESNGQGNDHLFEDINNDQFAD